MSAAAGRSAASSIIHNPWTAFVQSAFFAFAFAHNIYNRFLVCVSGVRYIRPFNVIISYIFNDQITRRGRAEAPFARLTAAVAHQPTDATGSVRQSSSCLVAPAFSLRSRSFSACAFFGSQCSGYGLVGSIARCETRPTLVYFLDSA